MPRPGRLEWSKEFPRLDELLATPANKRHLPENHDLLDDVWTQMKDHPVTWKIAQGAAKKAGVDLDRHEDLFRVNVIHKHVVRALVKYDPKIYKQPFSEFFNQFLFRNILAAARNIRQMLRKKSAVRQFFENHDASLIKPDPEGFGKYLELQMKAKELRTPEEEKELSEGRKTYYEQRLFHRFLTQKTKKADPVKFYLSKEATREDYRHVARKLAVVHPELKEELLKLADAKALESKYYTPDDILWALRQKDDDFLYGIFRHLAVKGSSQRGEPKYLSQRKRRKFLRRWAKKPKSYVLAHEEGAKGIFFGDIQVIRRVRAHEFTHAVARLVKTFPQLAWLRNHNAVYAKEELFRLEKGLKTAATPPKRYQEGVRLGKEAYENGFEAVIGSDGKPVRRYNPDKAMTYLHERFTTDLHGPKPAMVAERHVPRLPNIRKTGWVKTKDLLDVIRPTLRGKRKTA